MSEEIVKFYKNLYSEQVGWRPKVDGFVSPYLSCRGEKLGRP